MVEDKMSKIIIDIVNNISHLLGILRKKTHLLKGVLGYSARNFKKLIITTIVYITLTKKYLTILNFSD